MHISKFNQNLSLVPRNLPGLEHTTMKQQVIPEVVKCLDDEGTQLLKRHYVMNNHTHYSTQLTSKQLVLFHSGLRHMKTTNPYWCVQPQSIDEVRNLFNS